MQAKLSIPPHRAASRQPRRSKRIKRSAAVILTAIFAAIIVIVYAIFSAPLTVIPAGTDFSLSRDRYQYFKVGFNSTVTLRGSYSADGNVDFYIMNQIQYDSKFLTILATGTTQAIRPGYWLAAQFFLARGATIAGAFSTSGALTFYVMTQAEANEFYASGGHNVSYVYRQVTSDPVDTNVTDGEYTLTFYPTSATTYTNVTVTQGFQAVYQTPIPAPSIYWSYSNQNSLNVPLSQGIYYLVWLNRNPAGSSYHVRISESIAAQK